MPAVLFAGHIRLMLTTTNITGPPSNIIPAPYYSVNAAQTGISNCVGIDPASCIKSNVVGTQMIRDFFS